MENRLDANTYHPERIAIVVQIKASRWEVRPIKLITKFLKNIVSTNPKGLPYIGLENIESNTGVYIETSEKESFGTAIKFKNGKILFPKLRPYLNKVYYSEFEGLYSTEFHILSSQVVDNEYLSHFLRSKFVVNQTKWLMSGNTLPRLQTADIENLLIPIPPLEIQSQIVEIFNQAYAEKRQKEAEAKELLASIDAYLLEQLGIVLPDKAEEKNVFYIPFSKVQGNRFDPFYHKDEFIILEDAISVGKYEKKPLKEILIFLESGSRPSGGVSQYESGVLSFGGEHVNNKCEIEIRNEKFIPLQYHLNHLNTETQLNDIILVKDGATTGKIGIIINPLHVGQNINEHVFMMRFNSSVNPFFILNLLATSFYQKKIGRIITGATVTGLTKEVVKNLQIPLPPLEIQTEIANHIRNIRERAKTLEIEAKEVIEKAKVEVEKMILGE